MNPPVADAGDDDGALTRQALSTTFGMFKPVGHVMIGLPTAAEVDVLVSALQHAGWPAATLTAKELI